MGRFIMPAGRPKALVTLIAELLGVTPSCVRLWRAQGARDFSANKAIRSAPQLFRYRACRQPCSVGMFAFDDLVNFKGHIPRTVCPNLLRLPADSVLRLGLRLWNLGEDGVDVHLSAPRCTFV